MIWYDIDKSDVILINLIKSHLSGFRKRVQRLEFINGIVILISFLSYHRSEIKIKIKIEKKILKQNQKNVFSVEKRGNKSSKGLEKVRNKRESILDDKKENNKR